MSAMSYLSVIERFHEYKNALHELTASILTGIAEPALLESEKNLRETFHSIAANYPFMALLYTLDAAGAQTSSNIASLLPGKADSLGLGKNRSERPYYSLAKNSDSVVVTEPYFSNNGSMLCITAAVKRYPAGSKEAGYIVLDIDLTKAIEFLMGDLARRRFMPAFKGIYSLIVAGLFAVAGVLLYAAGAEMISLWHIGSNKEDLHMKPFGVIIFLTLALAIFDLGKTILEEEVLMHKDIFRHSSTRRTITRFIAAILIAVSIEALLLMFKAALGVNGDILSAVAMMLTAVGLLIGLGIYVYLGARAEAILKGSRR
ncbi:MAG TPA: PDC sensor domain-containing protein [Gallionellaceae bacterium]|nr:PDC sensor domain-containing protein [Gallionellaceae bacterium]